MTTLQRLAAGLLLASAAATLPAQQIPQPIDLPTSKRLSAVPGAPQRLNSLPVSMSLSPDGRYVVTVNAGYATFESGYMQSLAVLDTTTGTVTDFPEAKSGTGRDSKQTLYSGLAFSPDGHHLYASIASLTNPVPDEAKGNTGSGILVYAFTDGKLTRERILTIPPQTLAAGRLTHLPLGDPSSTTVPYPADLALVPGTGPAGHTDRLLIAGNLSDDVLLMDAATGNILHRFDLAETDAVPSTYPIALAVTPDGRRAFVALWNASEIAELNLTTNTVVRKLPLLKPESPIKPGTHPCAFALSPDGRTLYVALSNRDAVAAVDIDKGHLATKGFFDARLPGQTYFGAEPEALAISPDGSRLYAGEAATDAVAVLDTHQLTPAATRKGFVEPLGFIPAEWMPMAMTSGRGPSAGRLFVATAKGRGTGPNNAPEPLTEAQEAAHHRGRPFTYIGNLLHGSLATIDTTTVDRNLAAWTQTVVADNRIRAGRETIRFADGSEAGFDPRNPNAAAGSPPSSVGGVLTGKARIHHVIYIIKENRTYDQILGDLATPDKKPVGNGDPSLTMYGADITPNEHKLALQFGVLDNFFDSGEVSGDGHVWSNAAIGTDYLEKGWEQNYRNGQRGYDFEGLVSQGYPLLQHIPDVNEPASGYLWTDLAAHNRTLLHFGEYISTSFCNDLKRHGAAVPSQEGPLVTAASRCEKKEIAPGEPLPAIWGGGTNLWPWPIPLIASNVPTKPELVGHFAPEAPDFNLRFPDQIRAQIFFQHLDGWTRDRAAGHDTMPNFINLRLGNDHTAGTTPGGPTPKASVADNDLAVGRVVEAISHSPFWDDTAIFVLEDDAQNGADHVDAHRSISLAISKYAPHGAGQTPFVDSTFYSTVSTIRTMETLLGLPPMNNNDAFSSLMAPEFAGPGDQPPYTADTSNRDNKLIYTANKPSAPGARESARMDFRHADRAPADQLNRILWQDAKGTTPPPAQLLAKTQAAQGRRRRITPSSESAAPPLPPHHTSPTSAALPLPPESPRSRRCRIPFPSAS